MPKRESFQTKKHNPRHANDSAEMKLAIFMEFSNAIHVNQTHIALVYYLNYVQCSLSAKLPKMKFGSLTLNAKSNSSSNVAKVIFKRVTHSNQKKLMKMKMLVFRLD